ncbi:glycosyltransferase [Deinococcus sp. YIM 134068]|uniref:glycosyltransferase n=1 Tax=Deinococcus lichenicola TaxID=3118910 RepID=UPI002F94C01A
MPDRRRPRSPHFYGLPLTPERLTHAVEEPTRAALLAEAEEVLQGCWRFFAFADAPSGPTLGGLTDWHRCELTGHRVGEGLTPAPDFRAPAGMGELRGIWEKSRHHHTTVLALAYALTGDSRYAEGAAARIHDWIGANPPLRGVNWSSGAELGLRLMSWAWCFELLRPHPKWGDWFGPESLLWPSVYRHQVCLEAFGARPPGSGDLLGGLAGQYVASVTWPVFPESAEWRREAKAKLMREATLQFFESGVCRERGLGAHVFATEALLLPALLGEKCGDAFDPAYLARVARAVAVVGRLWGVDGSPTPSHDVEERLSVQLEPRAGLRVDWLLRVGRDWLGVPVPEPRGDEFVRGGARAGRGRVVYNATTLPPLPPVHPASSPAQFAAMGRLVPGKGFDRLLRSVHLARQAGADFRVNVAGEGPERGHLETLARALGLEDTVRFVGYVPDPHGFLARHDAFLLTSTAEGFANVLVEAMSCRLPVVAMDIRYGPNEIVVPGETGFLVPDGDLFGFAARLSELAAAPALRARLGTAGRARAEAVFSTARMTAQFRDVFAQAAGRPRPQKEETHVQHSW